MPEVEVFADAETLAATVAERAATVLARAQQERARAVLALTAGSIMEQVWSAVAASAASKSSRE